VTSSRGGSHLRQLAVRWKRVWENQYMNWVTAQPKPPKNRYCDIFGYSPRADRSDLAARNPVTPIIPSRCHLNVVAAQAGSGTCISWHLGTDSLLNEIGSGQPIAIALVVRISCVAFGVPIFARPGVRTVLKTYRFQMSNGWLLTNNRAFQNILRDAWNPHGRHFSSSRCLQSAGGTVRVLLTGVVQHQPLSRDMPAD
jgi:hypothetical protein